MALIVKIGANMAKFDKEMKKLTRDVNRVGDKLKDVGTKLTAGITLPVAAAGAAAVKTGMDFESSMSKVAAISGATGDDLEALEKKAREMGATTQFSAAESAEALQYMALAGWDTNQMISALPGVLDLAAAGALDLASASDIVTDMMSMFGMSAEEATRASDVFARAQATSNTDVQQLGEALKYVGATANAAGMDLEQTSAVLGVFANNGLKGSQAGTTLDAMFRDLRKSVEDGKIAIGDASVEVYDAEGNMRSMADIMADVENATKGMSAEQRDAALSSVFQSQALRGVNILMAEGTEAIYDLEKGLYDSAGAARETAEIMNDNLAGRLKELQSALSEIGLIIYDALKPALESLVESIKRVADWFVELSPETQNLIMGIAAIAAAIGPLLIAVGTGLTLFAKLKAALAILKISFMAVAWPILAVIAALAAIVAVVVYWEQIKAFFIKLWDDLKRLFFASVNYIRNLCVRIFEWIANFFRQWGTTILAILTGPIGMLVLLISRNWDSIKQATSQMWNSLKNTVMKPVNYIRNKVSSAFEGMKNIALGAWQGLGNGMKNIINSIIKLINKFIGGFNGPANLLSKIPGVSVPTIPKIPLLATGGKLFGSGSAIVGEAGPELVQKSGSSVKVTPLSSQERSGGIGGALGGGATNEVNLQVGTLVADKYSLKKLERMLQDIRFNEDDRLGVD